VRQTFGTFATATSVPTRHSAAMREMSVTEQRYKAVQAVIGAGRTVGEVASEWGVCRQTMHRWLARYEGEGLEGLGNRSSRPAHCPHQMAPDVEAMVLEMRRAHAYWGARRIAFELARKHIQRALRVGDLSLPGAGGGHRPISRRRRTRWRRGTRLRGRRRRGAPVGRALQGCGMLLSVRRTASYLRRLTASFDSFAGT